MTSSKQPWGWHLILDAKRGDISKVTSREYLDKFARALVERIDMKAYGDPILENFANHDPTKGGFTLIQLIETSNIAAHFVDATGDFYLDIFSCKHFEVDDVEEFVNEWLEPEEWNTRFITRG